MKLVFDQWTRRVEDEESGEIVFQCNSNLQYYGLMKVLLSPSQHDKHMGDSKDLTLSISKKRLEAGKEYMKNNPYNTKTTS